MSLTSKNIAVNALYHGVTLVVLPWAVLTMEDSLGFGRDGVAALRMAAVGLAVAGVTLQLWCITVFQRMGEGTPSPLLPPRRLVVSGPYRWLRNPMNAGEVAVFLALAGWFGSWALAAYALLGWVAFHVFVVLHEEPRLTALFEGRYDRYRREVGRWMPGAGRTHGLTDG
jgi:protein-S-isoprenylcysteine O-methyltransferase Ste14